MRLSLLSLVLLLGQESAATDIYKYIDVDDPNKEGKSNEDADIDSTESMLKDELMDLEAEIERELDENQGQCLRPFDDPFVGTQEV